MPHCGGCSCTPPAVLGVLSHCWERPKEPSGSSAAPGWEGCRGGSPHPTGAPQEPDAELQEGKLLDRVYNTYLLMHTHQTVDFVRKKVRPPPRPGPSFPTCGPPAAGGRHAAAPPTPHSSAAGPALVHQPAWGAPTPHMAPGRVPRGFGVAAQVGEGVTIPSACRLHRAPSTGPAPCAR